MTDEAKHHSPIRSTFETWLCSVQLGVVEKNWALSVDQCWLQLQFLVHLIDFLSILLRCNNVFTGIQKAVVDQTGSRTSVTMTIFGASLALGSALELFLSPSTELVIVSYTKSTFCHTSQSD